MSGAKATRTSGTVRVLIVDDHPIVREGLAACIGAQPGWEVCGEASTIEQALELVGTTAPTIMLVDMALKHESGLDLIKRVKGAEGDGPKILVVSAYEEAFFAQRALRAGAQGYINKQELQGSILEAIRTLLRGDLYLSADMTQRLAKQTLTAKKALPGVEILSDRELHVFQLIGRGRSTRDIAQQLHVSIHTVESHRENIRAKLKLRNGTELLQHAMHWTIKNAS
jgi:DNA-binding NarL/FixJ family response regulator